MREQNMQLFVHRPQYYAKVKTIGKAVRPSTIVHSDPYSVVQSNLRYGVQHSKSTNLASAKQPRTPPRLRPIAQASIPV